MLYTIIPPILIVISLVGIIIFLVKKAPEVASLVEKDNSGKDNKKTGISKIFPLSLMRQKNVQDHKDFKHSVLLVLEKITKKLKVFFLRMENIFTSWGESIRNKRKAREEEHIIRALELIEENNFSDKPKKDLEYSSDSGKTTEEENKIEKKNILEDILMERIAINPKDIEAYERLGEYYLEIENWNYAKECFKQVLKLNPRSIGIRNKMRKLERMLEK